mmetsp:Transcript_20663/g.30744  ORF Transcript_20663/g.30744 Transcript_20663/m.30744 type:complete len:230 (-) Transcript_20663:647-1336(-)
MDEICRKGCFRKFLRKRCGIIETSLKKCQERHVHINIENATRYKKAYNPTKIVIIYKKDTEQRYKTSFHQRPNIKRRNRYVKSICKTSSIKPLPPIRCNTNDEHQDVTNKRPDCYRHTIKHVVYNYHSKHKHTNTAHKKTIHEPSLPFGQIIFFSLCVKSSCCLYRRRRSIHESTINQTEYEQPDQIPCYRSMRKIDNRIVLDLKFNDSSDWIDSTGAYNERQKQSFDL